MKNSLEPGIPEPQPCIVRMAQCDARHHICAGADEGRGMQPHGPSLSTHLLPTHPGGLFWSWLRHCRTQATGTASGACHCGSHRSDGSVMAPTHGLALRLNSTRISLTVAMQRIMKARACFSMYPHVSGCRRVFLFLSVGRMFLSRRLGSPRHAISHRYGCRHADWQAFVNHKAPQLESGPSPRSADRRDRKTIVSIWRHRADSFWKADTA
ncbi:hypothetical protein [Azospirillum endophyticum]